MATFSLVGSDTIKIRGRTITNFPHGEVAKITFAADIVTVKTGKNGNTIYAHNASGFQATMELKVLRGGEDDKVLNTDLLLYRGTPESYVVFGGELVKNIGTGTPATEGGAIGKVTSDTYVLSGGIPSKNVEVVSNVEGDVEQAICVYTFQFATCERAV